jgi:hypothetical protein
MFKMIKNYINCSSEAIITNSTMYCLGCDPGTKNLGIAIIDSDTLEIVYLNCVNLFLDDNGTEIEFDQKLVGYFLERFVKKNKHIFSKVKLFCVENQIMVRMQRVGFGAEALFSQYGRAVTVHPSSVKAHFGTRKGEYAQNKRAAVAWCNNNLEGENLVRFREFERKGLKTDDVADAVMLARFGIDRQEELLKIVLKEKGIKQKKKKRRKTKRSPKK